MIKTIKVPKKKLHLSYIEFMGFTWIIDGWYYGFIERIDNPIKHYVHKQYKIISKESYKPKVILKLFNIWLIYYKC